MSNTFLGVDLGGTHARYGLVTSEGDIIRQGRFLVRSERGPEAILADLRGHLKTMLLETPENRRPQGLAMGVAGRVLPEEGVLLFAPNLPGWRDVPVSRIMSEALELEVKLANDADLYALGEWLAGAGRGLGNLVVLTLGTGVGGGLVMNSRLRTGSFGSAAEIGHMTVEPNGTPCRCGSIGCLETIASGTAMASTARAWIEEGQACSYEGPLPELTAVHLYELARAGDSLARRVFERAGWALGVILASIFNLLGLEGAVIGGGASVAYDYIKTTMLSEFAARVLAVDLNRIRFAQAALGDDAPLVGAPALFRSNGLIA